MEQPLNSYNERIWWRYEFQLTQSNLPQINCLIWVKENNRTQFCKTGLFQDKSF